MYLFCNKCKKFIHKHCSCCLVCCCCCPSSFHCSNDSECEDILPNSSENNIASVITKQPSSNSGMEKSGGKKLTDRENLVTKITTDSKNEENDKTRVDEKALKKVLCGRDWSDYYVVIYSIAGLKRMGKSFLLNFLYHYFKAYQQHVQKLEKGFEVDLDSLNESDVFKQEIEKKVNELFDSRSGFGSCTQGIFITSTPLIFKHVESKVAVFFMDTQGMFDFKSEQNSMFIGIFSFLMSSLQCINFSRTVDSESIKAVEEFESYCKDPDLSLPSLKMEKLLFVIRDYDGPAEYFGLNKAKGTLERSVTSLKETFHDVASLLLPYPFSDQSYESKDDNVEHTTQEFQNQIFNLFTAMAFENNEPVFFKKKLNSKQLTCKQLFDELVKCAEILKRRTFISSSQIDLENEMKSFVMESFQGFSKFFQDWDGDNKDFKNELENAQQAANTFFAENMSILNKNSSLEEMWINEFDNLIKQVVNIILATNGIEKKFQSSIENFRQWKSDKSGVQSGFHPSDEQKERAKTFRKKEAKQMEKTIKIEVKTLSKNMNPTNESQQSKDRTTSKDLKNHFKEEKKRIAEDCKTCFDKQTNMILRERQNKVEKEKNTIVLDLGKIDTGKFFSPLSSEVSSLALVKFESAKVTVSKPPLTLTFSLFCH